MTVIFAVGSQASGIRWATIQAFVEIAVFPCLTNNSQGLFFFVFVVTAKHIIWRSRVHQKEEEPLDKEGL